MISFQVPIKKWTEQKMIVVFSFFQQYKIYS